MRLIESRKALPATAGLALAILIAVLAGLLTLWISQRRELQRFERQRASALGALDLAENAPSASARIDLARPMETFYVGLRMAGGGRVSISIVGERGVIGRVSTSRGHSFSLGRAIPPGAYVLSLERDGGGGAASMIVSAEPVIAARLTSWQIASRTWLVLLIAAAAFAPLARRPRFARYRTWSRAAFHGLLLGAALMVAYLSFHEGGHAIARITFGRFDLSRSDVFGIAGHPHAGGSMGSALAPWKQHLISAAGPLIPTLAGLFLFLVWKLRTVARTRASHPLANLYGSSLVGALVLPEVLIQPAALLGSVEMEGNLAGIAARGTAAGLGADAFLWALVLASAAILWRVIPEIARAWTTEFAPS